MSLFFFLANKWREEKQLKSTKRTTIRFILNLLWIVDVLIDQLKWSNQNVFAGEFIFCK